MWPLLDVTSSNSVFADSYGQIQTNRYKSYTSSDDEDEIKWTTENAGKSSCVKSKNMKGHIFK